MITIAERIPEDFQIGAKPQILIWNGVSNPLYREILH